MIFSTILSLFVMIIKNIVIFFVGSLLVQNKKILYYLGIAPIRDYESSDITSMKKPVNIEKLISLIGLLIQIMAIANIITEIVTTVIVISRLS